MEGVGRAVKAPLPPHIHTGGMLHLSSCLLVPWLACPYRKCPSSACASKDPGLSALGSVTYQGHEYAGIVLRSSRVG